MEDQADLIADAIEQAETIARYLREVQFRHELARRDWRSGDDLGERQKCFEVAHLADEEARKLHLDMEVLCMKLAGEADA